MSTAALANTWHERLAQLRALEAEAERHAITILDPLQAAFLGMFPAWPTMGKEGREIAQRWMEQSGFNAACDRSDTLGEQIVNLAGDLIREPAPDCAAALWKFRYLYGSESSGEGEWHPEYVAQAHIDIEHFLENN
ncbi:hypothetical protein [Synechococcus phage Yong-M3-232]|nr:hypothetical protein [Synechococcus phage Yong-M3-232]